ncbi:hypothetical protein MVEN_01346900 [Mycena venus]|uniref:DUF6534 domain-containing protein n=1 Tax=Mycena venus TaxID=2733690 RepID=A0A8H6Y1V3_9AGAR|nr:hypothetical protein MVEN_01346900 [Mycena venus]
MNAFDPEHRFNPDSNRGAYQIGVLVSYALFGVTTTQTYIYFNHFSDDSRKLKALVGFIWVCGLAHALCVGHALYIHTISTRDVLLSSKTIYVSFLIAGLIAACVQGFFGFRIYAFSKKLRLPILIWIMAFLRLAASNSIFLLEPARAVPLRLAETQYWVQSSGWGIGVANDLMITTTIVFILRRQSTGVHERTLALVDKLISWSIETGIMTSAVGIVQLICFLALPPENWIWIAVFTIEARIYANSFLASLNGRTTLRTMNDAPLSFAIPEAEFTSSSDQITNVRPVRPSGLGVDAGHSGQV